MKHPRRAGILTFATGMEGDCHQWIKVLQYSASNEIQQPVGTVEETDLNMKKHRTTTCSTKEVVFLIISLFQTSIIIN